MRSFVMWLATAGAVGALAGTMLRPGFPEIVIVWAVFVGASYGFQSLRRRRRLAHS